MKKELKELLELPIYGTLEAARYVGVPYQTLRYWLKGSESVSPIINPAATNPLRLSFLNLLESHMLGAMRGIYGLRLPRVRRAIRTAERLFPSLHPLVECQFQTDQIDLFIEKLPHELINLSRGGQFAIKEALEMHLQRIEPDPSGLFNFFPFVEERSPSEPKLIMMNPAVAFGKPVITGTGISTALVASRFHARESIRDLAEEYNRSEKEIEEAIRWESKLLAA